MCKKDSLPKNRTGHGLAAHRVPHQRKNLCRLASVPAPSFSRVEGSGSSVSSATPSPSARLLSPWAPPGTPHDSSCSVSEVTPAPANEDYFTEQYAKLKLTKVQDKLFIKYYYVGVLYTTC